MLLEEESRKYTAFAVQGSGLWQFKRLAFGLNNGPATFGYLDDVIVITKTFEEHLQWLEFVLKKLVGEGLAIRFEKSDFVARRSRTSDIYWIMRAYGRIRNASNRY